MEPTIIFVAILVVLFLIWISKEKAVKRPPGPYGLPIVGYMPFMTKKPYVTFKKLAETYGPVYSVRLGSRKILLLCDFESIKKAFAEDVFMGRPLDGVFQFSDTNAKLEVFFGPRWKEQRRFSLHMLRDLGFGKTKMELHMKEEVQELLQLMEEKMQNPIKVASIILPSTSNNIASLLFGSRMDYSDPKRIKLDRLLRDVGRSAGAVNWFFFFPWLARIASFFKVGNQAKFSQAIVDAKEFITKEMIAHEETLNPNNIRDFMDGYLLEIQKKSGDPNTTFHKDILVDLSRLFFGAGSETVRITVEWSLLISVAYPEVQRRIHKEIDDVLGCDRFPTWADRFEMPYTEATICEVLRWATIIPLNLIRCTLEDTELNGYFIKKQTRVIANLYAVAKDESLWGPDVHDFKPERFLSKDGKKVVKPEYFIPFSIGKRACPGRTLAEIEVFLYVVAILQKFNISMPEGQEADLNGTLGIGLAPKEQDICLALRL